MDHLIEYIRKHMSNVLLEEEIDDARFVFFSDFFDEYKFLNISTLLKADRVELITLLIISERPDMDVNLVFDVIWKNHVQLYKMSTGIFNMLENIITSNSKKNIGEKIFNCLDKLYLNSYLQLIKFYCDNNLDISSLGINTIINRMQEEMNECDNEFESLIDTTKIRIREKEKRKLTYKYIELNWDIKKILEPLNEARRVYESMLKEKRKNRMKLNKLDKSYNDILKTIENACSKEEVIEVEDNFFGTIEDLEFKKYVLEEIYLYNKQIYINIDKKYNEMIMNSSLRYKSFLEKNGIELDDLSLKIVMFNSLDDLKEIITCLKSKSISLPEILSQIIQISDKEIVKRFVSLMDLGIISKDFLLGHLDLLNKNSAIYVNFIYILNIIEERNINPYLFHCSQEIFLIDKDIFAKNIDILIKYDLFNHFKAIENYTFFTNDNLSNSINTLLELGFENYLENDLTLLNYFNRLKILKQLNIEIDSKESLITVLKDDKFFIPDSMIHEYISNEENYIDIICQEKNIFENCKETLRTYIIGNKIISKNKISNILLNKNLIIEEDAKKKVNQ